MKKAIAMLLVIAMTAALAIGGTLAYLTDTDEDVNVMTLGQVKIDQLEYERVDVETEDEDADVQEFHDNKPLLPAVTEDGFNYVPGDSYVNWDQIGKDGYTSDIWDPTKINNEVDKMVFVKNKGDWDAYVRTVFAFEAGNYTTLDEFNAKMHLNLNTTDFTWEWVETPMTIGEGTYFVAVATYNKVLTPGALTEISLSQIALDKTATNDDVAGFGDTFQVLVQSQAVQAAGFADPDTALNEAFGEIPPAPFDDDDPTKGIGLKKALNYYEGGSTKITSKVRNIVFGKTADYAAAVAGYDATLVDVEQDVPAYAYYVKNGDYYDVYVLSSDVVYAPENSANLCENMTKLLTVDTSNFDVSRVKDMSFMFMGCNSLTTLDVSDWDTSNVTTLFATFASCFALEELDVSKWDTGSNTSIRSTFHSCRALTTLDLSSWDVSNCTDFFNLFYTCHNLEEIKGLENWDTSNVTNMLQVFYECKNLKTVDVSTWDVSKVTDLGFFFKFCYNLNGVDVSDWKPSSCERFNSFFSDCTSLTLDKDQLKNWDMSSAVKINHMFYNCPLVEELDLSGWDMPNLITTTHMFADCTSLKTVNLDNWNTPSLVSLDCMFNDCGNLVYVDMSDIDTSNVTEFSQLFERCYSLEKIDGLDQWDTSKAGTFAEMFLGCSALKELDLSAFDTRAAYDNYYDTNNSYSNAFRPFSSDMNSLVKLIVSDKISYYGNGNVSEGNKLVLPAPAPKDGFTAKWRNVETGELYLATEIPEGVAATYEAYYEAIPTT